jgi:hypothetical protein
MWEQYRRAFEKSAVTNLRDCDIDIICPDIPPARTDCKYSYTANNLKLKLWVKAVLASDVPVVLIDIDTVILKDLWDIFHKDFDIAVTERPGKAWFNGGVVFVKPTEAAKRDLAVWLEFDSQLYNSRIINPGDRKPSKLKEIQDSTEHDGQNQPSFVHLYNKGLFKSKVIKLPSSLYNNCDQVWAKFTKATRIVHVKGKLRQRLKDGLRMTQIEYQWRPIAMAIRKYYMYT